MACEHPLDFKTLLKRMLTFRDERVVACPVCGQKVRVEFDKGMGRWLSGPVPAIPLMIWTPASASFRAKRRAVSLP